MQPLMNSTLRGEGKFILNPKSRTIDAGTAMQIKSPAMVNQGSSAITPPKREVSHSSISVDIESMRKSRLGDQQITGELLEFHSAIARQEDENQIAQETTMKMGLPDQGYFFRENSGGLPERKEIKSRKKKYN